MNTKIRYLVAILIVAILLEPAIADEQPPGIPFDAIWKEINSIKDTITNLQQQINNIQLIPGPKGDKGDQGFPGISGYEMITKTVFVAGNEYGAAELICPNGKKIISGGYDQGDTGGLWHVLRSSPTDSKDGWIVTVKNEYDTYYSFNAYAICANIQ